VILSYIYFGIIRKFSRRRVLSHKPNGEDGGFTIELKNKVLDEIHNPSKEVARQVIKQSPRSPNLTRKRAATEVTSLRKELSSFSL
jgi:hypothetical protein